MFQVMHMITPKRTEAEMSQLIKDMAEALYLGYEDRIGPAKSRQAKHDRRKRAKEKAAMLAEHCLSKPVTSDA